jgi:hypothetical protein
VNRGNGLAGPRVAARTVKAVRRTVAAEEGVGTSFGPVLGTCHSCAVNDDDDLALAVDGGATSRRNRSNTRLLDPRGVALPAREAEAPES